MSHKQAISVLEKDAAVPKAQCLHSSELPYSTEILSWIVQRWFVPFVPPQDIPPSMQSTLHNPRPTNHICIKANSHCSLPLHSEAFLRERDLICQLPVCERCRKHTFTAVIVPPWVQPWNQTHFPQPVCSRSWVISKNHNVKLSFSFKTAASHNRGASSWRISNSSPSQNSAGINTCQAGAAGKVFHYPINLLVYPCPSLRLPEITATPDRLMLCLFLFSFL